MIYWLRLTCFHQSKGSFAGWAFRDHPLTIKHCRAHLWMHINSCLTETINPSLGKNRVWASEGPNQNSAAIDRKNGWSPPSTLRIFRTISPENASKGSKQKFFRASKSEKQGFDFQTWIDGSNKATTVMQFWKGSEMLSRVWNRVRTPISLTGTALSRGTPVWIEKNEWT